MDSTQPLGIPQPLQPTGVVCLKRIGKKKKDAVEMEDEDLQAKGKYVSGGAIHKGGMSKRRRVHDDPLASRCNEMAKCDKIGRVIGVKRRQLFGCQCCNEKGCDEEMNQNAGSIYIANICAKPSDELNLEKSRQGAGEKNEKVREGCWSSDQSGCRELNNEGSSGEYIAHKGSQRCIVVGCEKFSQGAGGKCKAHGGGQRCNEKGCNKLSRGASGKCIAHGGGQRCMEKGCDKPTRGTGGKCIAHGGGRRCDEPGCKKLSKGATGKCIAHGGGQRCNEPGCKKLSKGSNGKCIGHGGVQHCAEADCDKTSQGTGDKRKPHGRHLDCGELDCNEQRRGGKGNGKARCVDKGESNGFERFRLMRSAIV